MPEFIPRPRIPEGLAEQVLRMMERNAQTQPGVAIAGAIEKMGLGALGGIQKREEQARQVGLMEEERKFKTGQATAEVEAAKALEAQRAESQMALKKQEERARYIRPVDSTVRAAYKKVHRQELPATITEMSVEQLTSLLDAQKKMELTEQGIVTGQQLSRQEISDAARSMAESGTAIDTLGGRGAQKTLIINEYEKLRKQNPRLLTPEQLNQQKKAGLAKAAALNGPQITNEIVAVDQYVSAIDAAIKLADAMPGGRFIPLNKWKIRAALDMYGSKSLNSDELAVLNTVISEIGMQSSRVFSGTAMTDTVFNNELKRLNTAYTKKMFVDSAQALKQIALVRKAELTESPVYMPGGTRTQGMRQPPQGVTPSTTPSIPAPSTVPPPKPGTVRMIGPDGRSWDIKLENVETGKARGLKIDTEYQQKAKP